MSGRDYGERDVDLVHKCNFRGAVLTARGVSDRGADMLQLRRFTLWDRNMNGFGLHRAFNFSEHGRAPLHGQQMCVLGLRFAGSGRTYYGGPWR